jgi:hypothetical protein
MPAISPLLDPLPPTGTKMLGATSTRARTALFVSRCEMEEFRNQHCCTVGVETFCRRDKDTWVP